jgi:hypothetical protein
MKTMRFVFIGRYTIFVKDNNRRSLREGVLPCHPCLTPLNVSTLSMDMTWPARI